MQQDQGNTEEIEARYERIESRLKSSSKWTPDAEVRYRRMYRSFITRKRPEDVASSTA